MEVVQAIHRLREPETTYDHLEIGGWIIQRIYEDDSVEVVVSVVVKRVFVSPNCHA